MKLFQRGIIKYLKIGFSTLEIGVYLDNFNGDIKYQCGILQRER
jgi:hypothetical protein